MNTDLQRVALKFLGVCAVILIGAIAYGAVVNNSIDVSASTICGTLIGAISGFLTTSAQHPPPPGTTEVRTTTTAPATPPDVAVTPHQEP